MRTKPYPWGEMSDAEICDVIQTEGKVITPDQVTTEFISGMRHYMTKYGNFPLPVISYMVRIDLANGVNVCACN